MSQPSGSFPDVLGNDRAPATGRVVILGQDQTAANPIVFRHLRCTADGFLIFNQRPNVNIIQSERTVAASLTATDLDFFGLFGASRVHFSVLNDTTRGTLFLRMANTVSLTNFSVKIPPQHSWSLPQSWGRLSGKVSGIWDVADGNARVDEWF